MVHIRDIGFSQSFFLDKRLDRLRVYRTPWYRYRGDWWEMDTYTFNADERYHLPGFCSGVWGARDIPDPGRGVVDRLRIAFTIGSHGPDGSTQATAIQRDITIAIAMVQSPTYLNYSIEKALDEGISWWLETVEYE